MVFTTKLTDAFNGQIQAEMWSSNMYLSMSVYFQDMGLTGCASWMKKQSQEEMEHAFKLIDFGIMRGGKIKISQVDAVPTEWDSPLAVLEKIYNQELLVSKCIDDLMDLAIAENDKATQEFLRWFVKEQIEEEDSAKSLLDKFNLFGSHALFYLDHELGKR